MPPKNRHNKPSASLWSRDNVPSPSSRLKEEKSGHFSTRLILLPSPLQRNFIGATLLPRFFIEFAFDAKSELGDRQKKQTAELPNRLETAPANPEHQNRTETQQKQGNQETPASNFSKPQKTRQNPLRCQSFFFFLHRQLPQPKENPQPETKNAPLLACESALFGAPCSFALPSLVLFLPFRNPFSSLLRIPDSLSAEANNRQSEPTSTFRCKAHKKHFLTPVSLQRILPIPPKHHRLKLFPTMARRNGALFSEFPPLAASSKCAIPNSERSRALANRLKKLSFSAATKRNCAIGKASQAGFLRFFSRSCHLQRTFLPFFLFFVIFCLTRGE